MFRNEFLSLKDITPESVLNFARKAGVSLQALLLRLDKSDSLFIKRYYRGCVVLVEQQEDRITIRAIAKPRSLNIARQLALMRPGETWKLKAHNGSEIHPVSLPAISFAMLDVVTAMSKSQKRYKICAAGVGSFEGIESFLLSFEEI
jgi:hypothetical protein